MLILVEYQCIGFEHVEFNAALIATVRYAYPGEKILFQAEPEHLRYVRRRLEHEGVEDIKYGTIDIPSRHAANHRRFFADLCLTKSILETASQNGATQVIFCSVTSPGLIALKFLLRIYRRLCCVAILHSTLELIKNRPSNPLARIFWMKTALSCVNLTRLRYLVLGPPIQNELRSALPRITQLVLVMDHPYFFQTSKPEDNRLGCESVRIGSFGVGHSSKGTDLLFKLAKDIEYCRTKNPVEFVIVGPITDPSLKPWLSGAGAVHLPAIDKPLTRDDFDRLANGVRYSIYLYPSDSYTLRASGAFFDALSFCKPIIALRTPYFEHYFNLLGNIGYLCDTYEELKELVIDLANKDYDETYIIQKETILRTRKRFDPMSLSEHLKSVLL